MICWKWIGAWESELLVDLVDGNAFHTHLRGDHRLPG